MLLQIGGGWGRVAGSAVITGAALLLAVVVVEAALLEAVPTAAEAGDSATVATTFGLNNGVYVRIFTLAPAPLLFAAIFGTPGLIFAIVMSAIQALWMAAAAIALAVSREPRLSGAL